MIWCNAVQRQYIFAWTFHVEEKAKQSDTQESITVLKPAHPPIVSWTSDRSSQWSKGQWVSFLQRARFPLEDDFKQYAVVLEHSPLRDNEFRFGFELQCIDALNATIVYSRLWPMLSQGPLNTTLSLSLF